MNLVYSSSVRTYGSNVCTFESNNLNRLCDQNDFGYPFNIRVVRCNNKIGNYISSSFSGDYLINDSNFVTCKRRFSNFACPINDPIASFANTSFTFTGSTAFCSHFNCTLNAQCLCEFQRLETVEYCGSRNEEIVEVLYETQGLIQAHTVSNNLFSRDISFFNATSNITVYQLNDICRIHSYFDRLDLVCNSLITAHVNVFSRNYNDVFSFTGNKFTLTFPSQLYKHALYLNVVLNIGTNVYYGRVFKFAQSFCDENPCLYCKEAWANWDCLSTWQQTRFILVSICVLIAFLLIIPIFIMIFLSLVLLAKLLSRNITISKFKLMKEKTKENEYIARIRRSNADLLKTALIIALFLPLCFAQHTCDIGQNSNAFVNLCSTDSHGVQTCVMSSQSSFSLDYPGQELCEQIYDANVNPPMLLGTLYVKYIMWVCYAVPDLMYRTSLWDGIAQSAENCYDSVDSHCNDSECDYVNAHSTTERLAYGRLTDSNLVNYPGDTYCLREDPVFSDFCFFQDPGCVWTGYATRPTGNVHGIYRATSQTCGAILSLELDLLNSNQSSTPSFFNIPSSASFNSTSGYSAIFSLDGIAPGSNECFDLTTAPAFTSPGFYYVHEVSEVNFPEEFKVGDIQGNLVTDFTLPGGNLLINHNLGRVVGASISNGATWTFDQDGLDKCYNEQICDQLPYSPDGISTIIPGIATDNTIDTMLVSVNTVCPSGPSLLGNFLIQNYTFQRQVQICDFDCSIVNITGCYDCDTCSYFNLACTFPTSCTVYFSSSEVNLRLTSSLLQDQILLPFCTGDKYKDGTLLITSGDNSQSLPFSFALSDPVTIVDPNFFNHTVYYAYELDSDSGFGDGFGSFLTDLFDGHWWSYIVFMLVIIFIVVFLCCLLYVCIMNIIPYTFSSVMVRKKTQ